MWWFANVVVVILLLVQPLATANSCTPTQEEVTQQRQFEALVENMNLPCNKLGIGCVRQQYVHCPMRDLLFYFFVLPLLSWTYYLT